MKESLLQWLNPEEASEDTPATSNPSTPPVNDIRAEVEAKSEAKPASFALNTKKPISIDEEFDELFSLKKTK